MTGPHSGETAFLAIEKIVADPAVARRLPVDVALRFHALPLAEDEGQITVAMADPDNTTAQEAIASALGRRPCLVRADPSIIDRMLMELFGGGASVPLSLRVCSFPNLVQDGTLAYAQYLAELLDGRVSRLDRAPRPSASDGDGFDAEGDLFIVEHPSLRLLRRMLSTGSKLPVAGPEGRPLGAVLVANGPRWPLKRILLVLSGSEGDGAALDWAVRLALKSHSLVTVLAVVPPVPAMYKGMARMDDGLPGLLRSDTALGQRMRQAARHLVEYQIVGTLRLRQGSPDWQICREVAEDDYDLVAVTADSPDLWGRWLDGDLLGHILRWIDRPVLVARPRTT